MIGGPKRNREYNPKKAFERRNKKKTWIKIQPWVSASRPSNY